MRMFAVIVMFFSGSMLLSVYSVPWEVKTAAMLLGGFGGLLAQPKRGA